MFNLGSFLSTILGQDNTKKLREFSHQVEKINSIEQEFENKSSDEFGSILATGISFMLFFQVLLNIGGISRTIPLTGIPLPMISTGGTSLIVTLASIGILFSINKKIEPENKTRKKINVSPVKLNNKLNLSRRLK